MASSVVRGGPCILNATLLWSLAALESIQQAFFTRGMFISQVTPSVQLLASELYATPLSASLSSAEVEGYLVGQLAVGTLRRANPSQLLNRSHFLETLQQGSAFPVGGVTMGPFSADCNQGLRQVWVGQLNANKSMELLNGYTFTFPGCHSNTSSLQKYLLFGQSAALTGVASSSGLKMRVGLLAAFEEQNRQGGIFGVQLRLVSLDDGYDPGPALQNIQHLLKREVFGIAGMYGTETSLAVVPLLSSAGVPILGPLSGSMDLRVPFNPYVVNIRASYYDEAIAMVDFLTKSNFIIRFSVLYQNDSYGHSGVLGLQRALSAIGLRLLSRGQYPRNTVEVGPALQDILVEAFPQLPQAIVMFCLPDAMLSFLRLAVKALPPETVRYTALTLD